MLLIFPKFEVQAQLEKKYMTSPNEDELLAENVEIKRAADTISILLCQVSRQNRDYKAKIDRLRVRPNL